LQIIRKIFAVSYSAIIVLFICCGLALIFFAALELWHGLNPSEALPLRSRFNFILEGIGLLTIAVVAPLPSESRRACCWQSGAYSSN